MLVLTTALSFMREGIDIIESINRNMVPLNAFFEHVPFRTPILQHFASPDFSALAMHTYMSTAITYMSTDYLREHCGYLHEHCLHNHTCYEAGKEEHQ